MKKYQCNKPTTIGDVLLGIIVWPIMLLSGAAYLMFILTPVILVGCLIWSLFR